MRNWLNPLKSNLKLREARHRLDKYVQVVRYASTQLLGISFLRKLKVAPLQSEPVLDVTQQTLGRKYLLANAVEHLESRGYRQVAIDRWRRDGSFTSRPSLLISQHREQLLFLF